MNRKNGPQNQLYRSFNTYKSKFYALECDISRTILDREINWSARVKRRIAVSLEDKVSARFSVTLVGQTQREHVDARSHVVVVESRVGVWGIVRWTGELLTPTISKRPGVINWYRTRAMQP